MTVDTATPAVTAAPLAPERLAEIAEDWLVQRGVPHFIKDAEKLERRPVHAAIGVALAFSFAVIVADGRGLSRAAEVAVATGLVLLAFVVDLGRRLRQGKQGRFRWPRPGWINESVIVSITFVTVLDAILEEDLRTGPLLLLAAWIIAVLAIAAATPLGTLRILRWAIGHPFREAGQNAKVLAGALPLLLLTVAFLFLTTELWDVATYMSITELAGTLGLFAGLGLCFLLVLVRARIAELERFTDWDAVRDCLGDRRPDPTAPIEHLEALVSGCLDDAATFDDWASFRAWLEARKGSLDPAERHGSDCGAFDEFLGKLDARLAKLSRGRLRITDDWRERRFARQRTTRAHLVLMRDGVWPPHGAVAAVPELSPQERWNITVVLLFGQAIQVLAVSLVMAAFFLLFGWLTVSDDTLAAWEVPPADGWLVWSGQHLTVTALLAAFAGLSYAVYASLFKDQREYFFAELDRKARQRMAVRALYRSVAAEHEPASANGAKAPSCAVPVP